MNRAWRLILIILLISGCNVGGAIKQDDQIVEIYNQRCAGCHGFDGQPAKANLPNIPDFRDPKFHSKRTDKQLQESITDGIPPIMPSFETRLKEPEIKALITYVRSFAKKK